MTYLNGSYLEDLAGDMGDDVGAENATVALSPATGEQTPAQLDLIQLPGGIIMQRKTFWIIVAVIAAVGIYSYMKRSKTREVSTADE